MNERFSYKRVLQFSRVLSLTHFIFFSLVLGQKIEAQIPPKDLKQGKWIGTFKPAHTNLALGVTLDVYLSQPNDIRDFPRLEAILKMALGGVNGYEFDVTHFKSINYNFSDGSLTFDESQADFLIKAKVVEDKKISGTLTSIFSGNPGSLELFYADKLPSGEPCDPEEPCEVGSNLTPLPSELFLPSLAGSYDGLCDQTPAKLEISTTWKQGEGQSDFLKNFAIQSRLLMPSQGCGNTSAAYCVFRGWDWAKFDFYQSILTLNSSRFSDSCTYGKEGHISCLVSTGMETKSCFFKATREKDQPFSIPEKSFKLSVTSQDRVPLPQNPLEQDTLRQHLEGTFSGYVFHEKDGRYGPIQWESLASISSDNPHNEANVFVSGVIKFLLGQNSDAKTMNFRVDRRTFFPSRGMTLRSEQSDLLLIIDAWNQGYISGTAYSESFGRIGPFELRKTTDLPLFPKNLSVQANPEGIFLEDSFGLPKGILPWQFDLRPNFTSQNGLWGMGGSVQVMSSSIPKYKISSGFYHLFDGRVYLSINESDTAQRTAVGQFQSSNKLVLKMSSSSAWGAKTSSHMAKQFSRK